MPKTAKRQTILHKVKFQHDPEAVSNGKGSKSNTSLGVNSNQIKKKKVMARLQNGDRPPRQQQDDPRQSQLKRDASGGSTGGGPSDSSCSAVDAARSAAPKPRGILYAASIIDRQAAFAVEKLVEAHAAKRGGASLKSLTLGPRVVEKKATHAVTCQVLKCKLQGSSSFWLMVGVSLVGGISSRSPGEFVFGEG